MKIVSSSKTRLHMEAQRRETSGSIKLGLLIILAIVIQWIGSLS